jgi:hypothetical protein
MEVLVMSDHTRIHKAREGARLQAKQNGDRTELALEHIADSLEAIREDLVALNVNLGGIAAAIAARKP